jgi:hypothetical protein
LSIRYDLKAARLDLPTLQQEWTEACASNILVRNGHKKRVRLHLKPYCPDEVPDEISRDLVVLHDIADLLRELEGLKPQFRGIERLWRGIDGEPSRIAALIKWARDLQTAVDTFQIDGVSRRTSETTSLDFSPTTFRTFVPVARCARPSRPCIRHSRRCIRRPGSWASVSASIGPKRSSASDPDGSAICSTGPARWKANVVRAPQWATWRAAASGA